MTGTVMASAGLCLHAVFKSGHADEMVMLQLNTLSRMERAMRQDTANARKVITRAGGQLVCSIQSSADDAVSEAAEQIVWLADDNRMIRTHLVNASPISREVYQFLAGSQVLVTTDPVDPSANAGEHANASEKQHANSALAAADVVYVDVVESSKAGGSRQNLGQSSTAVLARIVLFTTASPNTSTALQTLDTGSSEPQTAITSESVDHLAASTGGLR